MTKRKIPEDFKGEESDSKRSNAKSSSVRHPEEHNSPHHIEDVEYEVLSEPEPVIPTVELIKYINGDAVYIPEQVEKWQSRYQEEKNNKIAIVELLILLIEACCAKFPTKAELLENHKIKEEFLHHYAIDKRLLADTHITRVMGALKNIAKIAESWGLATGLQIATELKITHIEVGTDSAILVNLIHGTLWYSHLQLHELDEYFYALFYRETENSMDNELGICRLHSLPAFAG